jgi:hypothetical protein
MKAAREMTRTAFAVSNNLTISFEIKKAREKDEKKGLR